MRPPTSCWRTVRSARWWASPPSPPIADGTDTVSYSLDDDAGGLFAIDATTGVVTVAGAIDREAASSYNITVRATSTDASSTTQVFTIAIGDVDEFDIGAVSDSDAAANTVAEDATVGTAVGITAPASDADATNNTITYTLDDDAGGLFAIDANTGVVTVNGALDYETATSHNITVRATSNDGSFATQSFTINVTDVNEVGRVGHQRQRCGGRLRAGERDGRHGGGRHAFADDPDGTDTVSYSLDDDAGGLFAIDANTGVVTVAGAIDREAASSLQHHGAGHQRPTPAAPRKSSRSPWATSMSSTSGRSATAMRRPTRG